MQGVYGDLATELGLSTAKANRLYDILVNEPESSGLQRDAATAAMLGPEPFLKFQNFEKSLGERMEMKQLADQLAAADVPLQAEQEKQILVAMLEEREISPQPIPAGLGAAEEAVQYVQSRKDYEQRTQERIANLLSPEQEVHYHEYLEWRSAMHTAAVETAAQ